MKSIAELIGTTYKGFKVIDSEKRGRRGYLLVECPVCHEEKWIRKDVIDNPKVKSCGCLRQKTEFQPVDIKGQRFGKLVALYPTGEKKNRQNVWRCKCDCGEFKDIVASKLLSGESRSCGCSVRENAKTKGKENLKSFEKKDCVEGTKLALLSDKMLKNNKSGVKGVFWDKSREKWVANIEFKGKKYILGRFNNIEDAAKARKEAEEKFFKPILEKYEEERMKEKRKMMVAKVKESYVYRLSVPSNMAKAIGVTNDDRDVILKLEGDRIIIEKEKKEE